MPDRKKILTLESFSDKNLSDIEKSSEEKKVEKDVNSYKTDKVFVKNNYRKFNENEREHNKSAEQNVQSQNSEKESQTWNKQPFNQSQGANFHKNYSGNFKKNQNILNKDKAPNQATNVFNKNFNKQDRFARRENFIQNNQSQNTSNITSDQDVKKEDNITNNSISPERNQGDNQYNRNNSNQGREGYQNRQFPERNNSNQGREGYQNRQFPERNNFYARNSNFVNRNFNSNNQNSPNNSSPNNSSPNRDGQNRENPHRDYQHKDGQNNFQNFKKTSQYREPTTADIALGFSLNIKRYSSDNQNFNRKFRNPNENFSDNTSQDRMNFNRRNFDRKNIKNKVFHKFIFDDKEINVTELAKSIHIKKKYILKFLNENGIKAKSHTILDIVAIQLVVEHFGHDFELTKEKTISDFTDIENSKFQTVEKPPVVTIIGHVDHGKTSLIDALNKTSIAEKEKGGITQHLGFYSIHYHNKEITFIDTPGHAAFEKVRKNGSDICDIVLLVIAADDGIKPQTIQAIEFIKNTDSKLIVVFNKIDKGQGNIKKIKNDLMGHDILLEEFGGDVRSVEISATKGINLNTLLDLILLEAEMLELKARIEGNATAVILENKHDKLKGTLINVLVKEGTLKVGDFIACGKVYGKIKAILDSNGKNIQKATPSQAVMIIGISETCNSGDTLIVVDKESDAKELTEKYKEEKSVKTQEKISKSNFLSNFKQKEKKILNIICKTDTQGSSDAIEFLIKELKNEEGEVNILYRNIGAITQTDINNAKMNNAIIYGFNVDYTSKNLINIARDFGVIFKNFNIIYEMVNDVKEEFYKIFEPISVEVVDGQVEVRQLFKISKIGLVIGCIVRDGKITSNSLLKLQDKKGEVIKRFTISSLKREKNNVREVISGLECGFSVKENDVEVNPGDILEVYHLEKKPRFKV